MEELIRLYQEIKTGRFELPCRRIELLLAPAYLQRCFEGSGVIRGIPRAGLEVLMIGRATTECLLDLWPYGRSPQQQELAPSWYQLRAWDWEGKEWIGQEWVRPQVKHGFDTALNGSSDVELSTTLISITTNDVNKLPVSRHEGERYQFIVPGVGHLWWSASKRTTTEGGPQGTTIMNTKCFHKAEIDGEPLPES